MSNSSASPSRNLVEFYKNRMLHPDAVRDVNVKSLFKDETVNTNIPAPLPPGSRVYYTGKRISESNPNLIDHLQVEPAIPRKECTNKTLQVGTVVFEKEGECIPNNALFGERPRKNLNNPSFRIGSNVFDGVKDVENPEILKHDKLFGEKVPAHRDTSSEPNYKIGTTVFDGVNEKNLSEIVLHDHLPGERPRFNIHNPLYKIGSSVFDGVKDLSRTADLAERGDNTPISNETPTHEIISQKKHSELSFNKSQINDLHASQDNEPNEPSHAHRKTISNTFKSEIFTELPPTPPKAMKPYDQRLSTDEIERLKNKSPKEPKLGHHLVSQISF